MIILAMEHPPAFIAQSAVGSMVSNAVCAIFALTYAALAQRRSLAVSLGGALLVWFGCAALTRLVDWSAAQRRAVECGGISDGDFRRPRLSRRRRDQPRDIDRGAILPGAPAW